jgi:putative spermidine/putrescine transport system permease protein
MVAGTRARTAASAIPRRRRRFTSAFVLAPFTAFVVLFLAWPAVVVLWRALTPGGEFTLSSLGRAVSGPYRTSFVLSAKLSLLSALIGGVIGLALAITLRGFTRPRWFRSAVDGWTAVASQLGGVPLAFAFIAALGTQGLVTKILAELGWDLRESSFRISDFSGWVLVYLYFQIPLMFLVMTPAVEGLRRTWDEAAASIGASRRQYWQHVGLPVLLPSIIAGFVLLFVNAFSAYATAYALSNGAGQLVPLQIRFVLQGNVISGEEDLGYALVAWTVLLLVVALTVISLLQRRVSRWTQR